MPNYSVEQTLVLIKPDALKLSLTGYILSSLSEPHTGLRIAGAKIVHVTDRLAEEHYSDHRDKPFFKDLIDYLTGRIHYVTESHKRRVVALVYVGKDAVSRIRQCVGPTNPHIAREEAPGTIRSLGTLVNGAYRLPPDSVNRIDNLVHASATADEAEREIKLWFTPCDICPQVRAWETVVCEQHYYCSDEGDLLTRHQKGATCLLAPGTPAWQSDIALLRDIIYNDRIDPRIWCVAAKYLINRSAVI